MQLHIRKMKTCSSGNELWALFPEGDIMHPICLMYEYEMQELCNDIAREYPEFKKPIYTEAP